MHARLATLLLVTAAAASLGALCNMCPEQEWLLAKPIDLGLDADLHAVDAGAERSRHVIAVGSAGTVVAWENRSGVVETWKVADVDLRGVSDSGGGRWVVVGDGGFAARTDNYNRPWEILDLQTSADLHAVVTHEETVVIVGDEVVRVLQDGTWLEPPTPEGGWGQLRGLGVSYPGEVFAVGLDGVIWSSDDPSEAWVAEDSGVAVDLFAVGPLQSGVAAVGANGTFLIRGADGWRTVETNRTTDFVAYQNVEPYGLLLAADGEVLQYHVEQGLESVDRFEHGRELTASSSNGHDPIGIDLIAVGDAGLAVSKTLVCE